MRASPDQWLHHTGAPKHLQATTRDTPGPHRTHEKGFPTVLINTHKGFYLLTPQRSHPTLLEWTFPEHDILMLKVLLEKRHQSLRREQGGPKHIIIILLNQALIN